LVFGVVVTLWLSDPTCVGAGQPHGVRAVPVAPAAAAYRERSRRTHAPPRVMGAQRPQASSDAAAATPLSPPELVPVSMPALSSRYAELEGHLDGSVVLTVRVDGDGRVLDAAVARSSGDAVLDAHARAVVAGWRFAVPPGYPRGFSGELPMRFGAANR
ncbi:energy transducer TonB family protein, partial [Dyella sp.]|uniref:energy transducer TonB family protein n=1 Tax=Dyella sp. TaxID=1869338 RepID=UPI003F7D1243